MYYLPSSKHSVQKSCILPVTCADTQYYVQLAFYVYYIMFSTCKPIVYIGVVLIQIYTLYDQHLFQVDLVCSSVVSFSIISTPA